MDIAGIIQSKLKKIKGKADKSVIGLDLGSAYVKVVQVSSEEGVPLLEKFASQKVEENTPEARVEAIGRALAKADIKDFKDIRIALGGESIIVRYIQMPRMTQEELDKSIDFEVEKYIPFKREDVALDCRIVEEQHHFDKTKMRVLLVVAKNDFINQQIETCKQAGLNLSLIDVDSFALVNAFLTYGKTDPAKTIVLLNIGARRTNINILKNNLPFFTRDISVAGNDLTQAVQDAMKADLAEAEKMKCDPENYEKEIPDILKPVLENLLVEVKLSFDYFENQVERGIDIVYLTGGSSVITGLDKYFSERLGLPVESWNPVQTINTGPDVSAQELKKQGARLGVCLGLTAR